MAAASARLGPGAFPEACAALMQSLPTVLGCAQKAVQADVQLALAHALLATATEAQLREEPEKCALLSFFPLLNAIVEEDHEASVCSRRHCADCLCLSIQALSIPDHQPE